MCYAAQRTEKKLSTKTASLFMRTNITVCFNSFYVCGAAYACARLRHSRNIFSRCFHNSQSAPIPHRHPNMIYYRAFRINDACVRLRDARAELPRAPLALAGAAALFMASHNFISLPPPMYKRKHMHATRVRNLTH